MKATSVLFKQKDSKMARCLKNIKRDKYLLTMFIPVALYYIIFSYIPMSGLIIAFKDYKPGGGIYNGKWVGFKWFVQYFGSPYAIRTIRNTILISLYSLVYGFPIPIIFAICITDIKNIKVRRLVQTVSYLPHFISTVVIVGMITMFFNMHNGIVNNIIFRFSGKQINFLVNPKWFRTLYVGSGIWQHFGFNSIIYIAAITSIDPTMFEVAKIDGITKIKQIYYVTIPMIMPTIIILFILRIGRIMSVGFEKVFLMYSPPVFETADVISTYVYRKGIEGSSYSFASAVGFFNSVINFMFVYTANRICYITTKTSMW
jgi:putative aldouronate transport system permease protein